MAARRKSLADSAASYEYRTPVGLPGVISGAGINNYWYCSWGLVNGELVIGNWFDCLLVVVRHITEHDGYFGELKCTTGKLPSKRGSHLTIGYVSRRLTRIPPVSRCGFTLMGSRNRRAIRFWKEDGTLQSGWNFIEPPRWGSHAAMRTCTAA